MAKGILYVVGTPIGNLADLSYRAVEVLSSVDLIAAEDTRHSRILLERYQIHTPITSFHSHNQARKTPQLLRRLEEGQTVALISDAGTPGISDPAYSLVSKAVEKGIPVTCVPGPAAFLVALVISGLPTHRFVFEGFLPTKKGRKTRLEELADEARTVILYESPYRLLRTLRDLRTYMGNRRVAVARELTKMYEEVVRGTLDQVIQHFEGKNIRGEFVIVLEGSERKKCKKKEQESE